MADSPQRKVPCRVLHLSMPRTGSVSMMAAYKMLGMTTYHGFDFAERTADQVEWERIFDKKYSKSSQKLTRADFDSFLGEFEVISDFPAIVFAEELIKLYPEAKVVLVDRDLDRWFKSYSEGVIAANYTMPVKILEIIEPYLDVRPATLFKKLNYALFHCHDQQSYNDNAINTYKQHYARVRQLTKPPERLLNYHLGSGWEPLCEFLGKPIPDGPFPHLNEAEEFMKWRDAAQRKFLFGALQTLARKLFLPALLIGILGYLIRFLI